ncbi:ExbD/TolR family protein [Bythopirellula goksoeyrii]|uniref:Biopolymer transport protein ExbD n=1 Tax=Bythopirellula goksoeyrii TaxID=1400387 RepID=A0A5B9QFD1_9BACT|nr:biopolymer transporter ExbD [Bythopirellula goksoeyrii]QEG33031.1 biopolymer transport protein ExbD [Bythopirellula goksoeyrii]
MRIESRGPHGIVEGDLTPMIDMAFLLIAFFMFVINFSEVEQDQRVTLPASELARPPESPYEQPLTIHITDDDHFIYGGKELVTIGALRSALLQETQIIKRLTTKNIGDVTIIVRGDEDAKTGMVQRVIQICQQLGFEKFALRGKQSDIRTIRGE